MTHIEQQSPKNLRLDLILLQKEKEKKKKKIGLDLSDCEENFKDLMKANSLTNRENCLENFLLGIPNNYQYH